MITLRAHQVKAFNYDLKRVSDCLGSVKFMEQRTGKTYVTVKTIASFKRLKKVLIIAPISAFSSWITALEHDEHNKIVVLMGTRSQRLKLLVTHKTPYKTFYILNTAGFLVIPEIKDFGFNAVVFDESDCLNNPTSKISKFFTKNFRNEFLQKFILTGTEGKTDLDYFNQIKFAIGDVLGCTNFYEFRKKHFYLSGFKWLIKYESKKLLNKFLFEHCYFIKRHEIPSYVASEAVVLSCEKSPEMLQEERDILSLFILNNPLTTCEIDSAVHKIACIQWLRQITGGFIKDKFVFNEKIILLKETIKQYADKKIIIWCCFIPEIEKVAKTLCVPFINGSIDRDERTKIIDKWKKGTKESKNILLVQTGCLKYGANLSEGDVMIYYTSPVSYRDRLQCNDRFITTENNSKKIIIDLVVRGSIDEDILKSISKTETTKELFTRIRMKALNENVY